MLLAGHDGGGAGLQERPEERMVAVCRRGTGNSSGKEIMPVQFGQDMPCIAQAAHLFGGPCRYCRQKGCDEQEFLRLIVQLIENFSGEIFEDPGLQVLFGQWPGLLRLRALQQQHKPRGPSLGFGMQMPDGLFSHFRVAPDELPRFIEREADFIPPYEPDRVVCAKTRKRAGGSFLLRINTWMPSGISASAVCMMP